MIRVCSVCGKEKDLEKEFSPIKCRGEGTYEHRCRDCERERLRETRERLRLAVFTHYGQKCACPGNCGETELLFLTIDHINDDGAEHRRKINPKNPLRMSGDAFYRWIVRNNFPDDLQVLCWNCNCGRHRNGGTCPHVTPRSDTE